LLSLFSPAICRIFFGSVAAPISPQQRNGGGNFGKVSRAQACHYRNAAKPWQQRRNTFSPTQGRHEKGSTQ